jgi:WXG100 family type VII secretion target
VGRVVASEQEFSALSRSYQQKAQEIHELASFLDGQIRGAMWEGNAASKFRAEWSTHHRNLNSLEQLLTQLSSELKTRGELTATLDRR